MRPAFLVSSAAFLSLIVASSTATAQNPVGSEPEMMDESGASEIALSDAFVDQDARASDTGTGERGSDGTDPDVLWERTWDGLWDAPWDDAYSEAYEAPNPLALHLSAGHRSNLVQVPALASGEGGELTRQSEVYALMTLQLPLESLIWKSGPRLPRVAQGSTSEHAADVIPNELSKERGVDSSEETTRDGDSADDSDSADAPATRTPPVPRKTVASRGDSSRALLHLVQEVAEHVALPDETLDRRLRSLVKRSRLSGLVPEMRLRGVYGFDQQTSQEDAAGIYPGETTLRGGRDSLVEARLTFRLDRLVFGSTESSLERQRVDSAERKRQLVAEAIEVLMDWRVMSSRAEDQSLLPEEQAAAQLKAEAALAELFLLTKGWFRGQETLRKLRIHLPPLETSAPPAP